MEIFDVTETDPSLLVIDNKEDISASLRAQRSRHCSAPSSVLRRGSLPVSAVSGLVPSRIQSIEAKIARTLQGDKLEAEAGVPFSYLMILKFRF